MIKIFTILGFAGAVLIVVLFNNLTGFALHSFSFLFVVPVGGLLVGAAATAGLFYGYLKYNRPVGVIQYLLGAVLGITAFFGIYYASYLTTYIDTDNNINHSFKGDPIAYFEIDGEPITFLKYLRFERESKSQFYFRGRPVGGEASTGGLGRIMFYLHFVAAALAGAVMGFLIVGDKRYCEKCKKYTKEKELFKFDIDSYDSSLQNIADAIEDSSKLRDMMKAVRLKDEKVNTFAQADIDYCPSCYDSRLFVKVYRLDSNDSFEEASKFRQVFHINGKIVRDLVKTT